MVPRAGDALRETFARRSSASLSLASRAWSSASLELRACFLGRQDISIRDQELASELFSDVLLVYLFHQTADAGGV